jgi:hypothetical protein
LGSKKTAAELRAENRYLRNLRLSFGITSFGGMLVKWGGLVAIARYGYLTVNALAGQQTAADIGINFLADIRVSEALAWLLAGCGVFYGRRERKLRKDSIERLQQRNRTLEKVIDPGRTSSNLTPRGDTRPEDEQ